MSCSTRRSSGDAAADARRLIDAIRSGRVYSVIDALATPGQPDVHGDQRTQTAQMGESLAIDGDVLLRASASAPPGTTLVLLRDGQRVHEVTDGPLETNGGKEPGVYRIEAYTANAPGGPPVPWIVSNPIYVGLAIGRRSPATSLSRVPHSRAHRRSRRRVGPERHERVVDVGRRRIRAHARSRAIRRSTWTFALSPGTPAGQFAAVRVPVSGGLAAFDRVRFRVSASAPMRVWVQLRAPVGNTERWGSDLLRRRRTTHRRCRVRDVLRDRRDVESRRRRSIASTRCCSWSIR